LDPDATNCIIPLFSRSVFDVDPSSNVSEPVVLSVSALTPKRADESLKVITRPWDIEVSGKVIEPALAFVFMSAKSVFKFSAILKMEDF
jgi:hypothetical protein